jgi:peroxiredoxin
VHCSTPIFSSLLLASFACAAPQSGSGGGGSSTSDFTLRDTEGRTVRLSDYLAKQNVVLLNFWATWCVPCAAELPHLQRMYDANKERGFVVLGISMDGPESVANVGPHARRYGITFPVLLDEETRVVGVYNPKRAAPFNVLIGRDGAIAKTREGYSAGDELAMEKDIGALLEVAGP